jgi:prepilin-type N-terminal cleavage/methylation domain-containing protein
MTGCYINNETLKRFSSQQFFSLIELLVVVSVIAILASLLLPALSRAKRKALDILCTNQLKQLYGGNCLFYSNDYDGFIAPATAPGGRFWFYPEFLGQYSGQDVLDANHYNKTNHEKNRFRCPVDEYKSFYSYAMNEALGTHALPAFYKPYVSFSQLKYPSLTFYIGDSGPAEILIYNNANRLQYMMPRHAPKKFNLLMIDGHIESRRGFSGLIQNPHSNTVLP